MMITIWLWN